MKRVLFAVILAVTFLIGVSVRANAQNIQNDIRDKRTSIKVENAAVGKVFQELIYEQGIPIGLEISPLDRDHNDFWFETNLPEYIVRNRQPRQRLNGSLSYEVHVEMLFNAKEHLISLDLKDASIDEVFDSVVRQMSNYRWEMIDGVVNIYPKSDRDPNFVKLLDMDVEKFHLGEKATLMHILSAVYELPEFEQFLEDQKLSVNRLRVGGNELMRRTPQDLKMSKVKIREILNSLAKVKGGGWLLRFSKKKSDDGKEIIDLDI